MDHPLETYALVVPDGVVTYCLRAVYDEQSRHTSIYHTGGLLHRDGSERSTPLDEDEVERYVAKYGAGRRLQATL